MDLELEVRTGRRQTLEVDYLRDLTLADLEAREVAPVAALPTLAKMRASHHEAAKAIAEGLTHVEVSFRTGYHPNRIGMLMMDPAFQELVQTYRELAKESWVDGVRKAAVVNLDLLNELDGRLEDKPETFTNREILEAIAVTGKQAGYGQPTKSEVNVNVNLSGRLEAARRRAQIIEGQVLPLPSTQEPIA